ncbi:putative biotin synthesis protein BioC, partial [Vibrio parahaemolyticus EKP-021]
ARTKHSKTIKVFYLQLIRFVLESYIYD